MRDFIAQWYRPERMVIAGAGMAHEELVELADKTFFFAEKWACGGWTSINVVILPHNPFAPPNLLHSQPPNVFKSPTRAVSSYLYPNSPSPALLTNGSVVTGSLMTRIPNSIISTLDLKALGFMTISTNL
ncbi:hypothetical protein BJV78DRAFT_220171 [Lactifluus subvellereus]|nr:hypothetical protein BJV78DRAFT_220171 [Lactifluus subvellereus]